MYDLLGILCVSPGGLFVLVQKSERVYAYMGKTVRPIMGACVCVAVDLSLII